MQKVCLNWWTFVAFLDANTNQYLNNDFCTQKTFMASATRKLKVSMYLKFVFLKRLYIVCVWELIHSQYWMWTTSEFFSFLVFNNGMKLGHNGVKFVGHRQRWKKFPCQQFISEFVSNVVLLTIYIRICLMLFCCIKRVRKAINSLHMVSRDFSLWCRP